MSAMRPFCFGR